MYSQLAVAAALLLFSHVQAVDETRDPFMDANLATAATQLDRLKLLSSDEDWMFDFTKQSPYYNFKPGGVTNMNAATFPAAKGNGMTSKSNNYLLLSIEHYSHAYSGYAKPWTLCHASTTLPPTCNKLRGSGKG